MISERERKIIRDLLAKGKVTEEELLEQYDYFESEIEDIKNPRDWYTIYMNADYATMFIDIKAVDSVLGDDWIAEYSYKEENLIRNGYSKFSLSLKITKEEFDKICEKAKEIREG